MEPDPDSQSVVGCISVIGHLKGRMKFVSELSPVEEIVLKGSIVAIAKSMRPEILESNYEGLWGLNKCKARVPCLMF